MAHLLRVSIPVGSLALLVSETVLVTTAFVVAAYSTLAFEPTVFLLEEGGLTRILVVTACILLGMHFHDLYTQIRIRSRILLLQQVSVTMGIAFLAQGFISYADPDLRMPIRVMLLGSAISAVGIFLWRNVYSGSILKLIGTQSLLFVGSNTVVETIAAHVQDHPELGFAVAGYVDDGVAAGACRPGGKVLGPMSALREIALGINVDRIVVSSRGQERGPTVADLLELRFSGTIVDEASTMYEEVCARISTIEMRPSKFVLSGELAPRPGVLMLQAAYNFGFALLVGILLLPVMAAIVIAIRLSSAGPVFERHTRVGWNGALFTLYRFRCAHLTKVGRFLDRTKMDRLPQLINVLRGDMLLVGPRPESPERATMLAESIPYYRQRQSLKAGMTGWAQINHDRHETLEDAAIELEYDLYYMKNMSMSLDAYVLLHAFKTALLAWNG
jgi:lipopolysaccharide/colanic/teichoic acid biosynthesis glycosyltransferase